MRETDKIVFDTAFAIVRQAGRFGDVSFPLAAVGGAAMAPARISRRRSVSTVVLLE